MSETVSSLPSRPLTERELQSLDDATAYCRDPDTGEAYIIVYISENSVSALGYEDRRDGWVQFHSRDTEFSEEAAQNLDDEIKGWTQARYGRQIDAGDLRMTGPYDPTPERDEAKEMPWEVKQGLEPEYDCPDCGFHESGLTKSPQDYLSPRRESRRLRRSESDNPKRFANDAMDGYSTLFRTIKSICLHRLYMAIQVTRTYIGSIQNQRQVQSGLDSLGDSASKIWNVARWTADRIWDETGKIPDVSVLKAYMKNQACWKDLNAQSSQKVIEELSDAFQSWFDLRQKDDTANPPGYRKHGDERPRSTVTFKEDGFKHDPDNNRVRLSKGSNLKGIGRISCCANTRPALTLISQKSTRYRTFVRSGTVTSGNYTSSVKSSSKPTTPQEMK